MDIVYGFYRCYNKSYNCYYCASTEGMVLILPKSSFKGGVHPLHNAGEGKTQTKGVPIKKYTPDTVAIPMAMHLGVPATPIVKKGDTVLVGQVIGEAQHPRSLAVHSSVSGEVIAVEERMQLGATPSTCVVIRNDFCDTWVDGIKGFGNVEEVDQSVIIPAIRDAGICGMGGACFPTHVKLTLPAGKVCDTIILNGSECETYMTCDPRLMLERPLKIIDGLRACMRALGVERGVVAIEDNKPDAIRAIADAAKGRKGVEVQVLKTKYPQGSEKQIIKAVTGKEVPSGGLPIDIGAIVMNVATAAAIADAIVDGKPLIDRITTVTGHVAVPSNLEVPIGTMIQDAITACDGYGDTPCKIIMGGGMTGLCAHDDTISIAKGSGGIVVLNEKEAKLMEEGPCIRCARCVSTCPAGLNPCLIRKLCDNEDYEGAKRENVMDCLLCGCCTYACPAHRFLTATCKIAKERIAKMRR